VEAGQPQTDASYAGAEETSTPSSPMAPEHTEDTAGCQ